MFLAQRSLRRNEGHDPRDVLETARSYAFCGHYALKGASGGCFLEAVVEVACSNADAWKSFRQALRDVPQQDGFALDIE
ncbi:phage tail assembly chaperone [Paraburkholderia dipogonis]|uniref:phage tail assembly chaperone n=1 Tax=Paraburkholderia dipogonis TaxID=1211383 RepID=UPI00141B519B